MCTFRVYTRVYRVYQLTCKYFPLRVILNLFGIHEFDTLVCLCLLLYLLV